MTPLMSCFCVLLLTTTKQKPTSCYYLFLKEECLYFRTLLTVFFIYNEEKIKFENITNNILQVSLSSFYTAVTPLP